MFAGFLGMLALFVAFIGGMSCEDKASSSSVTGFLIAFALAAQAFAFWVGGAS